MSSKSWTVKITRHAERDLKFWRKTNHKVFQKCVELLYEIENDPTNLETTGCPEWLKGNFSHCMSRRLTKGDRCVYEVIAKDRVIKVLQMRFHYDER